MDLQSIWISIASSTAVLSPVTVEDRGYSLHLQKEKAVLRRPFELALNAQVKCLWRNSFLESSGFSKSPSSSFSGMAFIDEVSTSEGGFVSSPRPASRVQSRSRIFSLLWIFLLERITDFLITCSSVVTAVGRRSISGDTMPLPIGIVHYFYLFLPLPRQPCG